MSGTSVEAAASQPSRRSDLDLYRFILSEARPYWLHILMIFGLTMLQTPLALLTPLPLKIVVDNVLGNEPLNLLLDAILPGWAAQGQSGLLLFSVALVIAVALLVRLKDLAISLLSTFTGEKLLLSFRSMLFRHVQRLSFSYHDAKGTHDAAYRIQYDASAVQRVAIEGVIPLVGAVITFAAMLFVILQISWELLAVALLISPFLIIFTRRYRVRLREESHSAKRAESSAFSVVQEVLTSIRVVKAFGQESREADRFERHSGDSLRAKLRLATTEGAFGLLLSLTVAVGTAATLYVGTHLVISGALTLGDLLLVLGYVGMMYEPLKALGRRTGSIQNALASADRAVELLQVAPDVADPQDGLPIERAAGRIEFINVSFTYPRESNPVLRDVSFVVEPGTRIGIAGTTGAGKTTLVSLVSRFYDPTSGSIRLDGADLRDYRLSDLRNQFAIVLQEPVLFSTSIRENIAYARPDASLEEIETAAEAADVHRFISSLPDGYETRVGERGMRMSGGERQRISLARAFLKDAPILILDEPTSSVDVRTEAAIMASMVRLMSGRTSLMIAHRLTTLEHCDRVLHLEDAALVPSRPLAEGLPRSRPQDSVPIEESAAIGGGGHAL